MNRAFEGQRSIIAGMMGLIVLFMVLACSLESPWLNTVDRIAAEGIWQLRTDALTLFFMRITALGSAKVYAVLLTVAFVFFFFVFQRKGQAVALIVALGGAWGWYLLLNVAFRRERPSVGGLFPEEGFSFPSGHATTSLAFYGMMAYLLWDLCAHRPRLRRWITVCFALLIAAIGFSRIYLGVHYASDVAAGFFVGGAWLLFCIYWVRKLRV